jgi:hypothetical protein
MPSKSARIPTDYRLWFELMVGRTVVALRRSELSELISIVDRWEVESWIVDDSENGIYATLGDVGPVKIDLWLDQYLGHEMGLRLGCWAMAQRRLDITDIWQEAQALWGPIQTVESIQRDSETQLLKPKPAKAIERAADGFILDNWAQQHFLGRYFHEIVPRAEHAPMGIVLTIVEELASLFALPSSATSRRKPGFNLADDDTRRRQLLNVLLRPQQAAFRESLMQHFGGRCIVSGCGVPQALEAAHIVPVHRHGSDRIENGLLLRSDLHMLFDAGLMRLRVAANSVTVHIEHSARRACPEYAELHLREIPAAHLTRQLNELRATGPS